MKQIINYAITLILWGVSILLWAYASFPYLCWLLLILHSVEYIAVGFKTGKAYGVGAGKSLGMCMLYGYNWWLPLQRQIKAETFRTADFVRED
jgi:hypothetical protein